jgi:hypothetical protein
MKQMIARNPLQDLPKYGVRHLCICRELWDKYPVNEKMLKFYGYEIRYNNPGLFPRISASYDELINRMGSYCTCGGKAAEVLNGIDFGTLSNVQIYTQCPLAKMLCIRKVLNQKSIPIPRVANDFFNFYKTHYHAKFMEAADKFLFITPKDVFESIKTFAKQLEVVPYFNKSTIVQLMSLTSHYSQHNKSELQSILDKVRQICNPEAYSKFLCLLFEKPLRCMMYYVFKDDYAVGLSNEEKQYEMNQKLKEELHATLDCSGFDNSHNAYLRQPWDYLISELASKYPHTFSSHVDPMVFKQEFAKTRSLIDYEFRVNKKRVKYCTLNIGDKLASGSVYTTVLNTFLMILLIKFATKDRAKTSVSGDDANANISGIGREEFGNQLYSVFGFANKRFFNNIGVMLKYAYISTDKTDSVPCSLDTFECPLCGIKMVRHFFKYIRDTFVSINYEKKFKPLGIPREHFEQLIYEGEKAWAQGLDFPMLVFSPLDHGIDVREISKNLMKVLSKKASAKMKLESDYTRKLELIHIASDTGDTSQLANIIMAIMSDTKYVKARKITNKPCCNLAYETFLQNKYNICTAKVRCFYNKEVNDQNLILDGENVTRCTGYIPHEMLEQCKIFYEKELAKTNIRTDPIYQIKAGMAVIDRYYYEDIDRIPDNLFPQCPADHESKLYQICKTMQELENEEIEPFEALLKDPSKYLHIINLFYRTNDGTIFTGCKQPVNLESTIKASDFRTITLIDAENQKYILKLDEPIYQSKTITGSKLKHLQTKTVNMKFEKLLQKMKPEEKEFTINEILDGNHPIVQYPNPEQKLYVPDLDLEPELVTITDCKMYMVTFERLFRQFGDIKYYHALQRCQKMQELMLSTPYRQAKIA